MECYYIQTFHPLEIVVREPISLFFLEAPAQGNFILEGLDLYKKKIDY